MTLPSPTGAFRIDYICPGENPRQFDEGYDDSPDSDNGSIDLNMTLDSGGIGRVAWGTAKTCKYLVPNEGDDCEAAGCSRANYGRQVRALRRPPCALSRVRDACKTVPGNAPPVVECPRDGREEAADAAEPHSDDRTSPHGIFHR